MEKKFVVVIDPGLRVRGMTELIADLENLHGICVMSIYKNGFKTSNVVVRYVHDSDKLRGLCPDEIFNGSASDIHYYRKPSDTLAWCGTLLDYIVFIETQAERMKLDSGNSRSIDIEEFVEKVIGIELLDYQKEMLRASSQLRKDDIKVVYGRGGKVYLVPVKEMADAILSNGNEKGD